MCCQSLSTFQLLGITIYNTFRDRVKRSTYKMLIFPALMYSNGSLGIRQLIYPPTGNFAKEKENCDTFFSSPFSFLVPLFSSTLSLSLSVSCSPWHLGLIRIRVIAGPRTTVSPLLPIHSSRIMKGTNCPTEVRIEFQEEEKSRIKTV